jgi:hypothetical protein
MLAVAGWSFAYAAVVLCWEAVGLGPFSGLGGVPAAAWGLLFGPLMGVAASFIGAGLLHGIARFLGGEAPFLDTYRIIAAVSAVAPVSALVGPVALGFVLVHGWILYLSAVAVVKVHRTRPGPTWAALGLLTAAALASAWSAQRSGALPSPRAGGKIPMPEEGSLTPDSRRALEQEPEAPSHSVGSRDPEKP